MKLGHMLQSRQRTPETQQATATALHHNEDALICLLLTVDDPDHRRPDSFRPGSVCGLYFCSGMQRQTQLCARKVTCSWGGAMLVFICVVFIFFKISTTACLPAASGHGNKVSSCFYFLDLIIYVDMSSLEPMCIHVYLQWMDRSVQPTMTFCSSRNTYLSRNIEIPTYSDEYQPLRSPFYWLKSINSKWGEKSTYTLTHFLYLLCSWNRQQDHHF